MVFAEDSQNRGAGLPGRVKGRERDGKVVFRVGFAYLIGWIGIVGGTVPGTKN